VFRPTLAKTTHRANHFASGFYLRLGADYFRMVGPR